MELHYIYTYGTYSSCLDICMPHVGLGRVIKLFELLCFSDFEIFNVLLISIVFLHTYIRNLLCICIVCMYVCMIVCTYVLYNAELTNYIPFLFSCKEYSLFNSNFNFSLDIYILVL